MESYDKSRLQRSVRINTKPRKGILKSKSVRGSLTPTVAELRKVINDHP